MVHYDFGGVQPWKMNGWNYKDMEVGDKADVFLIFFDFPVQSCVIFSSSMSIFQGCIFLVKERPC